MHEKNRLCSRSEIAEACPGGRDRAIVRPVLRSFWRPRLVEDGWWRGRNGQTVRHACVYAWSSSLQDEWICWLPASCQPSAGWCAVVGPGHQDDKLGAYHQHDDKLFRPVAAEPESRVVADAFLTVASDLFTTMPTPPVHACSSSVYCWSHLTTKCSRSQPMPFKSCTASCHNTSQHIPPYPHSQELFHCLFPCLPSSHSPIATNHTRLFACLLFGFCSGFAVARAVLLSIFFPWLSFLLAGSLGKSGFVHFLHFWEILVLQISSIFEKFSFWLVFVLSRHPGNRAKAITSPTPKQATSHRSPHDTTLSLPTQPHTTYSSPHPPLAPSTPQSHPQHRVKETIVQLCSPNIPLREGDYTDWRHNCWLSRLNFRVWIPNLGALPILASVSLTHLPCLFACFYESASCVYAFLSTCLSICVVRPACFVFGPVFMTTFLFSCFFFLQIIDTYITLPIDVRITRLLCLSSFSNCKFVSLIPA